MITVPRVTLPVALVGALALSGCAHSKGTPSSSAPVPQAATAAGAVSTEPKVHKLPSGLIYEDLVIGDGKMADPGLMVTVHYTGWLTNGTKFDSSLDRGQPFKFILGNGKVIPGWDQGVKGMRVGGKRKLTIPSDLGYGPEGAGSAIPPNSTLVFEVQLLGVE